METPSRPLLKSITMQGFLSFGSEPVEVPLMVRAPPAEFDAGSDMPDAATGLAEPNHVTVGGFKVHGAPSPVRSLTTS